LSDCDKPEFDRWRWVDYWAPVDEIISFKRDVYKQALKELEPYL
jgi:putative (di)nucleoside polyphosphate hydrolase